MMRKQWIWIAVTGALMAMSSAYAQLGQRRMTGVRDDNERSAPLQPVDQAQRETPTQPPEMQRPVRMSPEERRQLRRDIDDAGRELYRRKLQHPAP